MLLQKVMIIVKIKRRKIIASTFLGWAVMGCSGRAAPLLSRF
jgi:hypothetical protein